MKKKKSIVTIDTSILKIIEDEGGKFILSGKANDALDRWADFLEQVQIANDLVKNELQEKMNKLNTNKIEGDTVVVSRRLYGEKYQVTDKESAQGFTKVITYEKADSKKIDDYYKEFNDLPQGIKLKDRSPSLSIKKIAIKKLLTKRRKKK